MTKIQTELFKFEDLKYKDFISKLTPSVKKDFFIGVRVPTIRKLAKEISFEEAKNFMNELPHKYYEETLLHGFLIQRMKDYNECLIEVKKFLPYVDNWATSDTMRPKCFEKNKNLVIKEIYNWLKSDKVYTIRFAIVTLMQMFLEDDFNEDQLLLVKQVKNSDYYVRMAVAWYYAEALEKQYDFAIKIIESKTLEKWTHNKTIQKALESKRIIPEHKEYLRTLKIN